ncbi:LacI family DNA-binding transcriptional regulator [Actinotalea sp. Marseille-Q4924]|uniref:LacI family DNA-binding transcriptional regulator n=1 Tax=Actinotalea sp. Marseille-Q4924 TaxID=2866571 RepID=UPI001CE4A080|nr:LacI family DNA-binding transcriptional regulator [Actinotalea sp. Marseille-Q4924]
MPTTEAAGASVPSKTDAEPDALASAPVEPEGDAPPRRREALSTLRRASPQNADKPPTIYDVARAAGVSHQTVTRYLQGYEGIRPATRDRVTDALKLLGYRPNLTARSLTTGRSHRIGALTHEIDRFGPSKIIHGAAAAARAAGYVMDIVTLDVSSPGSIEEALELLRHHDLAGVLALSSTDEMTSAFERADFGVPAFIGAEPDDTGGETRSELTTTGFRSLIEHLADHGHRDFLHIAGPRTWSSARNRVRAYETELTSHGLRAVGTVHGDWSARSGYEAVRSLAGGVEATAIVASNDQMALGAMLALEECGLRIPDDISVTGVDDVPDAAYYRPPLTTLRVDFAAQGRQAVTQLLGRISGEEPALEAALPNELIVRRSTARAPGRRRRR